MRLTVPYYRQKTSYLCGPASLQMVLDFFGDYHSQATLLNAMRLPRKRVRKEGVPNQKMIETAQRAGFYCYVNEDATIEEIRYFINLGFPVIVNYTEPSNDDGHFAVVLGYGRLMKTIIMNDPWNGKNFKLTCAQFLRRWHSESKNHTRWLMVVSKKPLKIGKQFFPRGAHARKHRASG